MLKVREGPRMRAYAKAVNVDIKEVLEFVNNAINNPTDYYKSEYPTETERRDAICAYMDWVTCYDLAAGINDRIREGLKEKKCSTTTDVNTVE